MTNNAWNSNIPVQVALGGTGAVTFTANGVLYGNTTSAIGVTTAGANGAVLIGATAAAPAFALLTSSGGSITYTTGANSLNLEVTPGFGLIPWTVVTGASQTASVNNGYASNHAGLCTITLPAAATVGQYVEVTNISATAIGWRIAQNAGQIIQFGNQTTTTGVTGYLQATATGDSVRLVCLVTNNNWQVLSSVGNITYN